jgi:hypothetical protein
MKMPSYFDIKMPVVSPKYWDFYCPEQRELIRVVDAAPKPLRRAVENCAVYFRREFNYDFVQYRAEHPAALSEAFLWIQQMEMVVGGCCFYWEKFRDGHECWVLGWVWLHPYVRRDGHLTKVWPYFREQYGEFWVSSPWSPAMQQFLKKNGEWDRLLAMAEPKVVTVSADGH